MRGQSGRNLIVGPSDSACTILREGLDKDLSFLREALDLTLLQAKRCIL